MDESGCSDMPESARVPLTVASDMLSRFRHWLEKRKAANEYLHPTEKSVTLHERPLRRCNRPGDIVLDLFAGSGILLTACEQMKRKAYLVEIDPIFATVIVNRYEELSGKSAEVCHD